MLEQLGHGLEPADAAAVLDTMADDVTLRVAVHDQAFDGLPAATQIIGVVLDGVLRTTSTSARRSRARPPRR